MNHLSEANKMKLDRDVREIAALLSDVGWSRFIMRSDFGLSLAAAVALVCGAREDFLSEDFYELLEEVNDRCALRFSAIWDLIEATSGKDVVVLNEEWEFPEQAQLFLNNLADLIEIS